MKRILILASLAIVFASSAAMSPPNDAGPKGAVENFYKAFNDGFVGPAEFATKDWNHINPFGGRRNGRDATLQEVRGVHQTFLKGVKETIRTIDFRFASNDVAVGTVVSTIGPFTSPDGVKHGQGNSIRTFVVVKRGERWLIMQDQNTPILAPATR
jgi:uncharacterized protein (TIGR02246 family)